MKRYSAFMPALILLSLAVLMVVAVHAQPPGDPDSALPGEVITGLVEFEGVRVYSGPDFAYDVIGELRQNASVEVLGRRGDFFYSWTGEQWFEISFEGETAWVYARMLRTSIPFNSVRPTGRPLPRNRDGRVPSAFDLSDDVCDSWVGEFTRSGEFANGDEYLTVTYPELPGANIYSVIVISPLGERTAHDSLTTTARIYLDDLNRTGGTYTWRVAPYWTISNFRSDWQQICLLQTGGTFDVPRPVLEPRPTRTFRSYYYRTYEPTATPPPLIP